MKVAANILTTIGGMVLLALAAVVAISMTLCGAGVGWVLAYTMSSYSVGAGVVGALCGGGLVAWFFIRAFDAPAPPLHRHEIPVNVRAAVIARDGFACRHCGSTDVSTFQIDHVVPWSKGGTDDISNLQTLCATCNESKGNRYTG